MNTVFSPIGSRGLTQGERFAPALAPQSAPADERSLEQFLVFAREYAHLFNFYELDGDKAGDWRHFFDVDISFLLARIATQNIAQDDFDAFRLAHRADWQGDVAVGAIIDAIYAHLRRIDRWYRRAQDIEGVAPSGEEPAMAHALRSVIAHELAQYVVAIIRDRDWEAQWRDAYRRDMAASAATLPWYADTPWGGDAAPLPGTADTATLLTILNAVIVAGGNLKDLAAARLQITLAERSNHPAHTTLYIAFIKLLQYLQADVNRFTERHLDYYYRQILKLQERPGQADGGYLMLQLAPPFPSYALPKGSLFTAGKDGNGDAIVYATDREIVLNQASIRSIRTTNVARAVPKSRGDVDLAWVEHVFAAPYANSQDGFGLPLTQPELGWQTFGRVDPRYFSTNVRLQAQIGFMLTSPVLLLGEGKRHVKLSLTFDSHNAAEIYAALLERMLAAYPEEPRPSFNKVVRDGFSLSLSGAKKWIAIERVSFRYRSETANKFSIDIRFTLPPDMPAIVANSALDGTIDSPWPVVRLMLNPFAKVYQYSSFTKLILESVEIKVDVRGLRTLQLTGGLGPINAAKPFYPFGPAPLAGAHFDVFHEELQKPNLERVAVAVDWLNLPPGKNGIGAYYADYDTELNNGDFKLALTMYAGRRWWPVSGLAPASQDDTAHGLLFAPIGRPAPAPLLGQTDEHALLFKMPDTRLCFTPPPYRFDDAAQPAAADKPDTIDAGTIRLTLAAPSYGFGSTLYPRLFNAQALRNAAHIFAKDPPEKFEALLNPPLAPLAKSASCDYAASDTISLIGGAKAAVDQFYYVYPFGTCARQADMRTSLLADEGYDGTLYIGLADVLAPQSLTLHFQFREKTAAVFSLARNDAASAEADTIAWRYLAGNVWRDFPKNAVQSEIADFTRSGLVKFDLPRDIDADNSAMPAGLVWLEARVKGLAVDNLLIDIIPHAVGVNRCTAPVDSEAPLSLAPGTIKAPLKKIPELQKILQPYPTQGGSQMESTTRYRARVSERLKHKQRASQPGDYEQLVLDRFDGIRQAKCITFNNSRAYPRPHAHSLPHPGEVIVAVVPQSVDGHPPAPFPIHLLSTIARYLQQHGAEFVKTISVRNLGYEYLKVSVNVEFAAAVPISVSTVMLNTAISDFLAPWLTDGTRPLELGVAVVHRHKVASFIRSLPYVSRVGEVLLSHFIKSGEGDVARQIETDDIECARLSTPWSVFLPVRQHGIHVADVGMAPVGGISDLAINDDFILTDRSVPGPAPAAFAAPAWPHARRYGLSLPRTSITEGAPHER